MKTTKFQDRCLAALAALLSVQGSAHSATVIAGSVSSSASAVGRALGSLVVGRTDCPLVSVRFGRGSWDARTPDEFRLTEAGWDRLGGDTRTSN